MRTSVYLSIPILCSVGFGCDSPDPGPPPPPTRSAEAAENTRDSELVSDQNPSERQEFAGMSFFVPESWNKVALSQMQMGIIAARFDATDGVQVTLSRSGGGVEANLDRWRGQVSGGEPEVLQTISVAGADAKLIKLVGEYNPGMGRPSIAEACMLGVIVPQAEQAYFIKVTGPLNRVQSIEDEFREFVRSARRD